MLLVESCGQRVEKSPLKPDFALRYFDVMFCQPALGRVGLAELDLFVEKVAKLGG